MTRLRPYLEPVLRRQQLWRKWRMTLMWWGGLAVVAGLAWVRAAISELSYSINSVGWFAVVAIAGTLGVILFTRRQAEVNYRQVARDIEEQHPELHAVLLTAVEQEPDPNTGKFNFLQERVINKAADAFVETGFSNAVPIRRLNFLRVASCGVLLSLCLIMTRLHRPQLSLPGKLEPRSNLEDTDASLPENLAELEKVDPGNAEVERGSALAVSARFGNADPGKVFMVITPKDGEKRRLELVKPLKDSIYWATLPSVQAPFAYHIDYDGRLSEDFSIGVFEYPQLDRADATLTYPAYTKIPERLVRDTRRLSFVEGTRLAYLFHLNKPVSSALLRDEGNETIELETDRLKPLAELPPIALRKSRNWRLELTDFKGRLNKVFPRIEVVVYRNKPPRIRIVNPRGDQQVSPLQEVAFAAEMEDDFGLLRHGFSYNLDGGPLKDFELSENGVVRLKALAEHMVALEDLAVNPGQLVSWFFWAEDMGVDAKPRRSFSDMFFAEIRPFEEIFRHGQAPQGEEQQPQQSLAKQAEELIKLQKQIINATWKLHRHPVNLEKDAAVLVEGQYKALETTNELLDLAQSEKAKEFLRDAADHMEQAVAHLTGASEEVGELTPALAAEQGAYQALLGLLAHEFEVSRSQSRSQSQANQQQRSERSQSQLDQLDLREEDDRYETESQAQRLQDSKEREQLQVLSRLKDLARRQEDLNQKLKEIENALRAAEDKPTQEELERQLKRLRDEQRRNLADLDEVNQRMEKQENRAEMAEERSQLEQTRQEMNKASEELQKGEISRAITSGARAQKDLQEMRDQLREKTSNQFAEEMREMRREARELSHQQEEIGKRLSTKDEGEKKQLSLTDENAEDNQEIADQLDRQKERLEGLLQNVREVVEKSELAEPLLNRKLHQSFRQAHQDQTEKSLEAASTLIREEEEALGSYPFLRTLEELMEKEPDKQDLINQLRAGDFRKATKTLGDRSERKLDKLKKGIEKAAESVLGIETEALKFAERELSALEQALQNEKAEGNLRESRESDSRQSSPEANESGEVEELAEKKTPDSGDDEAAEPSSGGRESKESQGQAPAQASGEPTQEGRESKEPSGGSAREDGQDRQSGQQASGRPERQGPESAQQGQSQQGNQQGQSSREGQASFLGNGFESSTGGQNPITGGNHREWTDRLRDVEEAVDLPQVREKVSQVRDDIRKMNREFQRHSKKPEWDLVEARILKPLNEIRRRLAEELAKRQSDKALVPIDRDPVPDQFDELVRRYYERLGKGK